MTLAQAASNAKATVNGIAIESASNTLDNVLEGLSLRVARVTTAPVSLDVNRDTASVKSSITDFTNAYNAMVKLVREQTAYNEGSKTGGTLQGDRTAVSLLNRLRTVIGSSSGATSTFTRLADVGLDPQRDGTLKINDTKLDSALGRLSELKDFFSRDSDGTVNDGFGTMLRQFADMTLATDGSLSTKSDSLRNRIDTLDKRSSQLEDRLVGTEERLRAQYTRLDSNMAALSGLQAYVAQQITLWNKNTS
jgi:flagellar hook-associated protein 2